LAQAAAKISKATLPELIEKFESGDDAPTPSQFRKLAEAYRRPTALFFLPKPPTDFQPMHDFRRIGGSGGYSPELVREIRMAHERRNVALDLLEELKLSAKTFDLTAELTESPDVVGARIRQACGVTMAEQTGRLWRTNPFKFWRFKVEALGVLVFQANRVAIDDMQGFSLAMPTFPVISVNEKNKRGRVFTLAHELTHLLLRRSGVCDLDETVARAPAEQRVEMFCNAVASATLLPQSEFLGDPLVANHSSADWRRDELDALADRYGVSALVILRRLLGLKRTTQAVYETRSKEYFAFYVREDREARERFAESESGPPVSDTTVRKLGSPFIRLVLEGYQEKSLTLNDVSSILGVKFKHLPKIAEKVHAVQ
jgi:Zn-dependent peptidase ImmA (M78 family)